MTDVAKGRTQSHLDIPLDDETAEAVPREPVFVDVVAEESEVRPIIPASFRSWENAKAWAGYQAGLNAHRLGYHAVRAIPVYLPKAAFWSVVGICRLAGRAFRWWWHAELSALEQEAAAKGDLMAGPRIAEQAREARRARGLFLLAGMVAFLLAALLVGLLAPGWVPAALVVTAAPWLAHIGRPRTMPIVRSAVVANRFRRINSDIVIRAYHKAGLCNPDKPGQQLEFVSTMQRDQRETGSQVIVDMPHGKTFADAMSVREKIASGLDVSTQQVYLRKGDRERRHELYVADRDPLAIKVGRTDMLDGKLRNIWKPMRIGKDERDRLVTLFLLWNSILIGAQPRKGKTFFLRLVLLYASLDPWVKVLVADGKKSPDLEKARLIAHRLVIGDAPNPRDHDPLTHFVEMLDEILDHIARVNDVLSDLPVEMCPEGKLTEALSRDPRHPDLRVWVVAIEEFQVYFETEDKELNLKIAQKMQRIMAQGPSAGVILLSSSQKPAGVGGGPDVPRLFNRYRDNHQVRFALKCGNMDVSKAILGGDAYAEGFDASALPVGDGENGTIDYRGIGILYGITDHAPTVRTFLADHEDAEKIFTKARALREHFGTLSGSAAGEEAAREHRDVLADIRRVFYAGEAWISWPQIAQRLREELPEHYADMTSDAVSAQARALKVPSVDGRDKSQGGKVVKGAKVAAVDAAIERRALNSAD